MPRWSVAIGVLSWGAAVLGGFGVLSAYASTPGAAATAPAVWPDAAGARDAARPTLLLFAHPWCPCTAASIEELHRLATRCAGQVLIRAVVLADPSWSLAEITESSVYRRLAQVPGAELVLDGGGELSRRFGAGTSGQALLYDRDGRLLFRGGLTPSRGCQGDSTGSLAIERLVRGDDGPPYAPVYGCSLCGE